MGYVAGQLQLSASRWEVKKKPDELQSIISGRLYWSLNMLKPALLHEEQSVSAPPALPQQALHQLTRAYAVCAA